MRLIATIMALFVVSTSATAQEWKEYAYPDDAFTVAFPADPKIETVSYQSSDGRPVEARVYSVAQDSGVFRMTVADLSETALEEKSVIDHAVNGLKQGGEVKIDITHRISQIYGRQLSIAGADGSHSFVALFFHDKRLYQIEGRAAAADATADALRFQQSLTFTDSPPRDRGARPGRG
jgi:hypothetical protein